MSISYLRGATEWALMVALVFGAGAIAQAQNDVNPESGVVQIGRADKADAKPNLPPPGEQGDDERPAPPKYWIGLFAGPIPADHPLRAHLDLPEKQGLLVANVIPDSPAAKAGLKPHDILLKGNNNDLSEMKNLIDLVMTEGPKKGQITLEILRHNKRESVNLKPEERPANVEMPQGIPGGPEGGIGPGMPGFPEAFMQQFGGQLPMEFRNLGPGVIVGGGSSEAFGGMPNGVSVSIQKQNDQPTHITVTRGKEKWEVTGDDAESLKKLPNDLRPFVERMLHGGGGGGGRIGGGAFHMQGFGPEGSETGPGINNGSMRERMERMEQTLKELQHRMHGPENPPAEKPKDQGNQAK